MRENLQLKKPVTSGNVQVSKFCTRYGNVDMKYYDASLKSNYVFKSFFVEIRMQPQSLWNAKMVIATVQRISITTVIGIVRIPQQTHGLLEKVVDMHAESHVVSVRGISSTTIFRCKYR